MQLSKPERRNPRQPTDVTCQDITIAAARRTKLRVIKFIMLARVYEAETAYTSVSISGVGELSCTRVWRLLELRSSASPQSFWQLVAALTTRAEHSIRPRVRELRERFPESPVLEVELQARARLASPVEALPAAPHRLPALPAGAVALRARV
jgi:hypothetical protein